MPRPAVLEIPVADAVVYKRGATVIAKAYDYDTERWLILYEGSSAASATQKAVNYVSANGGGKVAVYGIDPGTISRVTRASNVTIEVIYRHITNLRIGSLASVLRIDRDGYVLPVAGSVMNINIGTGTTPNSEDCFGIFVYMHTSQAPGRGTVRGPFYAILKIAQTANFYGWGYTAVVEDHSNNYGQHVGFYANVKGDGAGQLWGFACEVHDNYGGRWNYNKTIVGMEIAMFKQNAKSRSVGLDIIAKGSQTHNIGIHVRGDSSYPNAKWNTGILIEPNGIGTWGIKFASGSCPVGISLDGATFTAAAIRLGKGQKIDLEPTGAYHLKCKTINNVDWIYFSKRVYSEGYLKAVEGMITKVDIGDYGGNFATYTPPTGQEGLIIVAIDTNATNPAKRLYIYANGAWHYVNLT